MLSARVSLKDLQVDDKVLLRIFADALDEFLCLGEGLVGVIIEGAILDELSERAFALIYTFEDLVELLHSVV